MSYFEELNDEKLKEEISLTESIHDNLLAEANEYAQYLAELKQEFAARKLIEKLVVVPMFPYYGG